MKQPSPYRWLPIEWSIGKRPPLSKSQQRAARKVTGIGYLRADQRFYYAQFDRKTVQERAFATLQSHSN